MDQILKPIGDTLSSFFESDIVQFGLRAIGLYLVILWLATAYWAFRDMQQRSDNAILPYLAAAFIILFTPIFFIFAFWFYKIVRPHEKIGEVWERNLAEEALLAEVESIHHCPGCDRRIDEEWIICPSCRTRLKRVCPNCSRLVGMDWSLCAWCGKDFERREAPAAMSALPASREATGRIATATPTPVQMATPATSSARGQASSASGHDEPTPLPSSVRSPGPVRPATGPLPTTPQDPLPER
ncbi:MAG: double zinc ribbon domain-containing protein [Chloroflexota bacterium]